LLGLLEKQGRLEERIRNVEDLVHDRHSRPRD
jgi:hypothetical protein